LFFLSEINSTVKSKINSQGDVTIEVDSIDNILNGEKVTYIKMDVEGAELETLKGGIDSIKKWKPKLAVSMYHKKEDLITIPKLIKEIRPDYSLFLRHHMYITQELVMYAV
jgi:hypothetical protein